MEIYRTKFGKIPGSRYKEVEKVAHIVYKKLYLNPRRRPYLKSKYFGNKKVFLELFWRHLHDKNMKERTLRLKFFEAAVDLIQNSKCKPEIKQKPPRYSEILYRFAGRIPSGEYFYVQIKEDRKTEQVSLMSVFAGKNI